MHGQSKEIMSDRKKHKIVKEKEEMEESVYAITEIREITRENRHNLQTEI